MHAKTEINAAKILSLLYHSIPSCGVFKIYKKKTQKYHASQDGVVFKIFEKILGKVPRKTKWSGIIRTKFLSRIPRKTK